MYELIQISEHDYYIDCPAKIGLVRIDETQVILIDSGSDKDAGKKVLKHINANNWQLKAIYNTHSHADHVGGNKLLQDRTGCKIYAKEREALYTSCPVLEPTGLYGGLPFKDIENKFLKAQPSMAEKLTEMDIPAGFRILDLPGHSFDMVGFLTPDGNAFVADSVIAESTIRKYGIGYLWSVSDSLKTLEYLKTLEAKQYIPAHAEVTDDISELIRVNIEGILDVKEKLVQMCTMPTGFEQILKQIFEVYGLTMNAQQYVLLGSTVRSYLSDMYTEGLVTFAFENNEMKWKTVE